MLHTRHTLLFNNMVVVVLILNLDGSRELTKLCFEDPDPNVFHTIKETVERRLDIPVENQFYYYLAEGVQNFMKWYGHLSWAGWTKLRLGYLPTIIERDEASELEEFEKFTKINGKYKYTTVDIYNKYRGSKVGDFHLRSNSTCGDLKVYLERKLGISADFLVVLRALERNRQLLTYWEPSQTEHLMSSLFSNECLPYVNSMYLLIKDSQQFTPNRITNTISKIRSIAIYTEHGSEGVTKLMVISPEENIFNILQIKEKIYQQIGILVDNQIIYKSAKSCEPEISGFSKCKLVDHSLGETLLADFFDSNENEIELYLTVTCKGNEGSLKIAKEIGVKRMEIVIASQSGDFIVYLQVSPNQTFYSLKETIRNDFQLSKRNQIFYSENFHILHDQETVWEYFGCQLINKTCKIFLLMIKNTPSHSLFDQYCSQLGILQVTPEIHVKSLDYSKELMKVNLNLKCMDEFFFWPFLSTELQKVLGIPQDSLVLSYEGETIANSKESNITDIRELFFYNGIVREVLVLNVTFQPTNDPVISKDFDKHDIPRLRTLKIKFLTHELEIDLGSIALKNVLDVKRYVSNEKKVPIGTIDVFFKGNILSNKEELVCLFVKSYINSTALDVNVVFQTTKDIEVHLQCPYPNRFKVSVEDFVISRSQTLHDLKEKVAGLTEVELCQLNITCKEASEFKDENHLFIDDIVRKRGSSSISVTVIKTVIINIVHNSGFTDSHKHDILHEDETVHDLLERTGLDLHFKLHASGKVTKKTILLDLNQDDNIKLKEKKENSCQLM